jgi:hypothetical protein
VYFPIPEKSSRNNRNKKSPMREVIGEALKFLLTFRAELDEKAYKK